MSGTFTSVAIGVLVLSAVGLGADSGSPGPLAQTCGVPPAAASTAGGEPSGARKLPQFPAGQYPVKLPPVSLLGAHNDLPDPYRAGVRSCHKQASWAVRSRLARVSG